MTVRRVRDGVTTVVLADRQPLIQGGLRALLSTVDGIVVVSEAATGPEAVRAVLRHRADVLVLDPRVDEHAGITIVQEVRSAAPDTAVLIVTTSADDASVRAAVRAGARGYLMKGAEEAGIVHVIRSMAAGEVIFGASIAGRIPALFGGPSPMAELTSREREILDLLCAGLSTVAIARRLQLAPKTIRNKLSTIFAKLRVANRTEAIAAGATLAG